MADGDGTPFYIYLADGTEIEVGACFVDRGEHVNNQPWDHVKLHQGKMYQVCDYQASLANNGEISIALEAAGALNLHCFFVVASEGKGTVIFRDDITSLAGGTNPTPKNKHKGFPDASTAVATLGGTPTDGTDECAELVPGGSGGVSVGAQAASRDETVIPSGEIGSFTFKNTSGNTKDTSFKIVFYESSE